MNSTQNPETTVRTYDVTLYTQEWPVTRLMSNTHDDKVKLSKNFLFNLKLLFFIKIKIIYYMT